MNGSQTLLFAPLLAAWLAMTIFSTQSRGASGSGTAGPQAPDDWQASWIGAQGPHAAPWLRKSFTLSEVCVRATAYVASIGYHELYINASKAGDGVLMPSVSDLSHRTRFETYDITTMVRTGENAVALWLGSGWAGFERFGRRGRPLVTARLEITTASGKTLSIVTDSSWKTSPSPLSLLGSWSFGHYGGERYETALEQPGWNDAGFDDSGWARARLFHPEITVSPDTVEPNRRIQTLRPESIVSLAMEEDALTTVRIDMGRQFTGILEMDLVGPPGGLVSIGVSERDDQAVTYDQRHELVLGSGGRGHFENRFNYTSGRWITVSGLTRAPRDDQVRAYLVRSAYRSITTFSCSDGLLQKIHDTAVWTLECLSLGGYLVDCPHRERWGYGGDAHATMKTALTHFDMRSFYAKWLEDWRDVQGPDGNVAYTAPTYEGGGGPAWSGIVIALPWEVYLHYGEREILEETYPCMKRWVEFLETRVSDGLVRPYGHPNWGFLGDWVAPGKGQNRGRRADDHSTLFFNNAYILGSFEKLARIAEILGESDDAARWQRRAAALGVRINEEFLDADRAAYACGEQPYLAEALLVDLPPADLRPAVLDRLEQEILVTKHGHLDTGIHGTYFLLEALGRAGRDDLIETVASQEDYPGWGWMLAEGATTFWEQWDGVNSRCHSSFLSIGAWFIEGLAGIRVDPQAPGYEHFIVRPAVVGDLTWVRCTIKTVRGPIMSNWHLEKEQFILEVGVPPGTTATVSLPVASPEGVTLGGRPAAEAESVRYAGTDEGRIRYEIPAGHALFAVPWK